MSHVSRTRGIDDSPSDFETNLRAGAQALGLVLSPEQIHQFKRYSDLLGEWNKVMNLTRIPPDEFVPLHFLDSLTVGATIDLSRPARLIDVGTGAGFPGLALKIAYPMLDVTLLDSTRKRLNFLDAVVAELGLTSVRTLHSRAEQAGRDSRHRERYDIAAARAVSRLNALAELMLPLIRVGGTVVAMKSAAVDDELEEGSAAAKDVGGTIPRVTAVTIPGTEIERSLVVIQKSGHTPAKYPRDASAIKSKPLGA
jgi:16S rRNA (guanine527-N7)-methyltransferase